MYPIICKIGPFTIFSYGLSIALAFSLALYLLIRKGVSLGFDGNVIYNLAFLVLIAGIIGARLLYVILHFDYYRGNLIEILMLQRGGLSWFGALISGCIAAFVYIRKRNLGLYKTLDLIFPFVALGQAVGRIGCLLNGCCYGKTSSFGIYFPVHGAVLIPTQAYSSLFLLLLFLVLRLTQERSKKHGVVFFTYLLLYSGFRFIIEFYRAEHAAILSGLNTFQLISVAIFLIAAVKLFRIKFSES